MMDTKDHALEEKDTEIDRLASKVEEANRTSKRYHNEEKHQEDVAMMLRQQVDSMTTENRRLTREKQLAEAMKFATEAKMEALEEKNAKAEGEAATLQRQLAAAAKKGGGEMEEVAQQLTEMRDEMSTLREQQQEASTKAETLASENVALRARAKTYDMFPGLGAPTRSLKAMEMVAEAEEDSGGMSLADEMAESLSDALAKDSSDEEDEHPEAPPRQEGPPPTGSVVELKRLEEAEFQYERLAGLVHFLQEDNVRLTQDQALMATEFLRLSNIVSDRSGPGRKGDQGPMAMVKKAGWVMKRNPRAVAGKYKWKRRYFVLEGPRLRYFENASSTAASGHINLEFYEAHWCVQPSFCSILRLSVILLHSSSSQHEICLETVG